MVEHLKTILKDKFYTAPVDEDIEMMPSPEDLKNKVLLKGKRLPPGKTEEEELAEDSDDDERDEAKKKKAKVNKYDLIYRVEKKYLDKT